MANYIEQTSICFSLEPGLGLMGESFGDNICAADVSVRTKGDKIALWNTECESKEADTRIWRIYKER